MSKNAKNGTQSILCVISDPKEKWPCYENGLNVTKNVMKLLNLFMGHLSDIARMVNAHRGEK